MTTVVIDTNVPVVANGAYPAASLTCRHACIEALLRCREQRVAIDEGYLILDEYRRHLSARGQPGVGDAFFKWLWDNHRNDQHCLLVAITTSGDSTRTFNEFPDDPALLTFDPSDRKFVAVALGSGTALPVLNATDSDWWNHEAALARHGVTVQSLCPDQRNRRATVSRS